MKTGILFFAVTAVIAGIIVGCSDGKSVMERGIRKEFQEKMDTEAAFKDYGIRVQKVVLVQTESHSYDGTVTISVDENKFNVPQGSTYDIAISVRGDRAAFKWEIDDDMDDYYDAFAFLSDIGVKPQPPPPPMTDARDGKVYRLARIGNLTWMAENLNYQTDNSWCYDNDNSNCAKYGRLYTWNAAMSACPVGWRVPSDADWSNLMTAVGISNTGRMLKSTAGWNNDGNGTDDYGFSALPGGGWHGDRWSGGGFHNGVGYNGYWWSATEDVAATAGYRDMLYLGNAITGAINKNSAFSLRCVMD